MLKKDPLRPPPKPSNLARSRNMAAIKSRGNKSTEVRVLKILKEIKAVGWRRHLALYGRPDFAFPRFKLAIFVNGCFWHGCPKCYVRPKTNSQYWTQKVGRNIARDRKNSRLLRAEGWSVMHIWEHSLKSDTSTVKNRISRTLKRRKFELGIE
jgi:DNA mismatch endonuclease (patch repair protein)